MGKPLLRELTIPKFPTCHRSFCASIEQPFEKEGRILKTDVTWSDLTLDYLGWDDFSFDAEREGETVHGQVCAVVLMRRGNRTVRVWVDRKTGALMQAEELPPLIAIVGTNSWNVDLK